MLSRPSSERAYGREYRYHGMRRIAANIAKLPELVRSTNASALMAKLQLPGNVVIEQILRNWLVAIG
jgi:hypothetical protein